MTTRAAMLAAVEADYVSTRCRAGWWSRRFPTLSFYSRVAAIVLRASERGRYGRFSRACWRDDAADVREAFEKGGVPVIVENLSVFDRVPGACLMIGNHMSTAETFIMASWLLRLRPITYVVKQGLVEYPIFKHIMTSCDPVVVGRQDPRADLRAVLEGGSARLEAGISIVLFPQKTRTVEFRPEEFNTIGVKLAKKAGVPVVPLALKTDAWANGTRLKDFGPFQNDRPVHFAFGEPLEVTGNGREQNEAVIAFIETKLKEWEDWDARWRAAR